MRRTFARRRFVLLLPFVLLFMAAAAVMLDLRPSELPAWRILGGAGLVCAALMTYDAAGYW